MSLAQTFQSILYTEPSEASVSEKSTKIVKETTEVKPQCGVDGGGRAVDRSASRSESRDCVGVWRI